MDRLETLYKYAEEDMAILAGEEVGPSDASWQDVAGTLAVTLRALANAMDDVRSGKKIAGRFPFASFPSMRVMCKRAEGSYDAD